MYTTRNVLFGLLAAAAGVSAADASDVTQLNKDTFNDFVKGNDLVLAECMSNMNCFVAFPMGNMAHLRMYSLCPVVWPLQGPRPRVRRGGHNAKGEVDQAGQDRLHRGG